MQQLYSLQTTRALAALMVVVFHMGFITQKYFGTEAFMAPAGRAGVEYFFVLSGFIITLAHRQDLGKPQRLPHYLRKRIVRIYPVYWVVFLLALVPAYHIVKLGALDTVRALLLLPAPTAPVIIVAWSLQYEMVFYAVFAAFILHPAAGMLAGVAVWFGLPVLEHGYLGMFLAGVAAALIYQQAWALPGRALAAAGAVIFALAGWQESRSGVPPQLAYACGAFCIVLGLASAEKTGWVLGPQKWMQALGASSYALYLVHYPLLSGLYKSAAALKLTGMAAALATYLLSLVACVAAGLVLHRWVERPLLGRLSLPRPGWRLPRPTR